MLFFSNVESLNFEILIEIEITTNKLASDLICMTDVQSPNLVTLKMAYFNELTKIRPHDHYLGKKSGGLMIFCRNNLSPRDVNVPG